MLSDTTRTGTTRGQRMARLNAPFGARCFLTHRKFPGGDGAGPGLNAAFGARCFLTRSCPPAQTGGSGSLNAPFGARCFLTHPCRDGHP